MITMLRKVRNNLFSELPRCIMYVLNRDGRNVLKLRSR
jgi:hypothetical protein